MSTKRIASTLLLVAAVLGTGFVVRELNDPQRAYRSSGKHEIFQTEGQPAPPFTAKIVGEDASFSRDDVDRPTLFMFFGTFCPHCKDQMPSVRALTQKYGDRAHIFAVNGREYANLPDEEREQRVADYLADNSWSDLPTLIAPVQMQSAFKLGAVPTVILIDRAGVIRYVGLAAHETSRLESLIDEAL